MNDAERHEMNESYDQLQASLNTAQKEITRLKGDLFVIRVAGTVLKNTIEAHLTKYDCKPRDDSGPCLNCTYWMKQGILVDHNNNHERIKKESIGDA